MSIWMLIVGATALGGALLLWNTVSRTKHASQQMLGEYRELLAGAREEKARQVAAEAEAAIEEVGEAAEADATLTMPAADDDGPAS